MVIPVLTESNCNPTSAKHTVSGRASSHAISYSKSHNADDPAMMQDSAVAMMPRTSRPRSKPTTSAKAPKAGKVVVKSKVAIISAAKSAPNSKVSGMTKAAAVSMKKAQISPVPRSPKVSSRSGRRIKSIRPLEAPGASGQPQLQRRQTSSTASEDNRNDRDTKPKVSLGARPRSANSFFQPTFPETVQHSAVQLPLLTASRA
eukprot:SAG11_NODE_2110_length_3805_cov_4.091203_2_plen_203_part_00